MNKILYTIICFVVGISTALSIGYVGNAMTKTEKDKIVEKIKDKETFTQTEAKEIIKEMNKNLKKKDGSIQINGELTIEKLLNI